MLVWVFRYLPILCGALLMSQTVTATIEHCISEWESLSNTAFLTSPVEMYKDCLYISYTKNLVDGFDTPSYREIMRESTILGSVQYGIDLLKIQGKIDQNTFRVLKSSCSKSTCQAVVTMVALDDTQLQNLSGNQSDLSNASFSAFDLFWWKWIAEELENSNSPIQKEHMQKLGTEIGVFAGRRAASFFLGEPEQPTCIQDRSLNSSDWFFLQNRCPYNVSDALQAGDFFNDKGYSKLAFIFYLRGAADIRSPILARASLSRLATTWEEMPPSSPEFLSCLKKTCERSKSSHPFCSLSILISAKDPCFLQ